MKRILKRTLAVLMTVVMLIGAAPVAGLTGLFIKSEAVDHAVGDIIEFGSYPQSRVNGGKIETELNKAPKTWVSYCYMSGAGTEWDDGSAKVSDYMKYCDVTIGNDKYRGVRFSTYRPRWTNYQSTTSSSDYTYQYENSYRINTTYWFKYEPLKWRVLDPSEGLVLCENIIDSQAYSNTLSVDNNGLNKEYENSTGAYASDYESSSIREWLNNDFYNTAFNSSQQSIIKKTNLENKSVGRKKYDSADTEDKVFLLSYWDVSKTSYGFPSYDSEYDVNRRAHGTPYAKCQGCYTYGFSWYTADGEDTSNWWLRSPASSGSARPIRDDGYPYHDFYVNDTSVGIRPALKITNLSSLISQSEEQDFYTEIRAVGGVQNKYYGSYTAKLSDEGKVFDAATELKEAFDKFYAIFSVDSNAAVLLTDDEIYNFGQELKAKDNDPKRKTNPCLTFPPDVTDTNDTMDVVDAAYFAAAKLLKNCAEEKMDFSKINYETRSAYSQLKANMKMVQEVLNAVQYGGDEIFEYGKYRIKTTTFGISNNLVATINVKAKGTTGNGKDVTMVTGSEITEKALLDLLEQLEAIVHDELKCAMNSILKEFGDATHFTTLADSTVKAAFKSKVNDKTIGKIFKNKNYGDIAFKMTQLLYGYKAIKDIYGKYKVIQGKIYRDDSGIAAVLIDANSIYKTIEKLDFSPEFLTNKIVQQALEGIKIAQRNFLDELSKYAEKKYLNIEVEQKPSLWDRLTGKAKKVSVQCPVDFEIYDEDNNLIGYVDSSEKHENYIYYSDDIIIEFYGDKKFIYAPDDMELNIKLIATDSGTLDYTVETIDNGVNTGRINYFDVPLTPGIEYTQTIEKNTELYTVQDSLKLISDEQSISATDYLSGEDETAHIDVSYSYEGCGFVLGDDSYPVGDMVSLTSIPFSDEYELAGWYVDGVKVCDDSNYQFTARENVDVVAKFERRFMENDLYDSLLGEKYIYSSAAIGMDYSMKPAARLTVQEDLIDDLASTSVVVKGYDAGNNEIVSQTVTPEILDGNRLGLNSLNVEDCASIELYDNENALIAKFEYASFDVWFEANGGECEQDDKIVKFGSVYGELPEPSRDWFEFDGWYTDEDYINKILPESIVSEKIYTLYAKWDLIDFNLKDNTGLTVDNDLIFGDALDNMSAEDLRNSFTNANIAVNMLNENSMATGTTVSLTDNDGSVLKTTTVTVSGDINGDGSRDGCDAVLAECIRNGLLDQNSLNAAQMKAADCNHDGAIDNLDVELLERSGVFLSQ